MWPLNNGGDKCQVLVREMVSLQTSWDHTRVVQLIQKWTNYVEIKLSTWQDKANLNMNKEG